MPAGDGPDTSEPTADAEAWLARLETLRRSVDLRLDDEGRWYHEGAPFEHAGLIAAFDRGIDLHPDSGEPILRLGGRWCYIRADDTPFVARRITLDGDRLAILLNTGERVAVPERGFETADGHLYISDGPRRIRLGRAAQAHVGQWLEEAEGRLQISAGGRCYPVQPAQAEPTA